MKNLITFLFILFAINLSSQNNTSFQRKGKFIVETGYNLVGGFGSGTGASILFLEDGVSTALGADIGVFLSNKFALKMNFGLIYSEDIDNVLMLTIGPKYYLLDKIPIELGVGLLNSDEAFLLSRFHIGYAGKVADNILFEISPGVLFSFEEFGAIDFKVGFTLLL